MASKPDRIAALHEKLEKIADARTMTTTTVWADAWNDYESELLDRALALDPEQHEARFGMLEAIKAVRRVRFTIENARAGAEAVEAELAQLEGRKLRPVA